MSFQSHSRALNTPEDEEMYLLPPDARGEKIHFIEDMRVPNAGLFRIYLENHTVGDIVRMQLLRSERVLFAGYQVPHPLEFKLLLRVQVDGLMNSSPGSAVVEATESIISETNSIETQFEEQLAMFSQQQEERESMNVLSGLSSFW